MTKYEDMLDDVIPEVPGCSVDVAINALRNACMELFQKSWIYTQNQDPITTEVGTAEYDMDSFTNQRIVGVVSAYLGDTPLIPLAEEMLNATNRHWATETGFVEGYMMTDSNLVRLYRIPEVTGTLNMKVALAPNKKSTGIETFVYDLYSEGIAAGAKARLMTIPKKPFTDLNTSLMYRAQFAATVSDARWRARQSLTSSNLLAMN